MAFIVKQRIDAPVSRVWRHMTDPALLAGWMSSIDDIRTADGGPLGTGTRLLFTARGAERSSDVIAFEPERQLTLRSTQGSVTATYQYDVAAVGAGGTQVTLTAECVATGLISMIMPLIRFLMKRVDGPQLKQLAQAATGESDSG